MFLQGLVQPRPSGQLWQGSVCKSVKKDPRTETKKFNYGKEPRIEGNSSKNSLLSRVQP